MGMVHAIANAKGPTKCFPGFFTLFRMTGPGAMKGGNKIDGSIFPPYESKNCPEYSGQFVKIHDQN
jgi:hypothetical protein